MNENKCPKCQSLGEYDGPILEYECGSRTYVVDGFVQSDRCRVRVLEDILGTEVSDWAETDTAVRNAARPVLGAWVDGDSNGVPGVKDIVVELVKRLAYPLGHRAAIDAAKGGAK